MAFNLEEFEKEIREEESVDHGLLDQIRVLAQAEQERRRTISTAKLQVDQIAEKYAQAIGRVDGDEWAQPQGAHDSYRKGATATHNGKTWESLISANVWEPGASGWREVVGESDAPAQFIPPTDAHDVYKKGDKVTFNGAVYRSSIDNNIWSPTDYPQGWEKL